MYGVKRYTNCDTYEEVNRLQEMKSFEKKVVKNRKLRQTNRTIEDFSK